MKDTITMTDNSPKMMSQKSKSRLNHTTSPLLSVVVPCFNEAEGLRHFHKELKASLQSISINHEIVYCDDGSTDTTTKIIKSLSTKDSSIRLVKLNRNFGKEIALIAGIHQSNGDAILTIDADGQHPVELIKKFVSKWDEGNKIVTGLRSSNQGEGVLKRYGSKLFYRAVQRLGDTKLTPNATDFRLIDKSVQQDFIYMNEHSRITRGLISWLGYQEVYIPFHAKPREYGTAGYSFRKLSKLAVDTTVSLSAFPLYIAGYIGLLLLPLAGLLGLCMVINAAIGDPFQLNITGGAYITVLLLFFTGILLASQGIVGLYLSRIHIETQNRPLYIIDRLESIKLHEK